MYDRSGGPLEETLKDGDPVTLEWRAPKAASSKKSFLDHIPGGALSLAALAAAGAAAVFVIVKKKKESKSEEE